MVETGKIKEIQPRQKILFINLNPGPESMAHISMATRTFDAEGSNISDFPEMMLTQIDSPPKDEIKGWGLKQSIESKLQLPENVDDVDAVIISGSPYNIGLLKRDLNELGVKRPGKGKEWFIPLWLGKVIDFVQAAHEKEKPMLGVCAGAQLISEALGGKLERLTENGQKVTERGWGVVKKTGRSDDPILADLPSQFITPLNHMYTITRVPPGAEVLAESRLGVQVFRIGNAWGVQFHPEKDKQKVEEYYDNPKTREKYQKWDWDMEAERRLGKDYRPELTKTIFNNFLKYSWKNAQ